MSRFDLLFYNINGLRASTTNSQRKTRLDALKPELQERLINWGYIACDGGLRSYYMHDELRGAPATTLPYKGQPLT